MISCIIVQSQVVQIMLLDLSFIHIPGFSTVLAINPAVNNFKTSFGLNREFEAVHNFHQTPSHK